MLENDTRRWRRRAASALSNAGPDCMSSVSEAIAAAERLLPGEPAPEGAEDPRWQAIIEIGAFCEEAPEAVWSFVVRWGNHPQDDLRSAIACCILEHLLDAHFDLIFPRIEPLALSDPRFADTFTRCWKMGQVAAPINARRFDALLQACKQRRSTRQSG